MPFAQRHDAIEALRLDRPDEALGVGVAVRRRRRGPNHPNADRPEQLLYRTAPLRIAIADQESAGAKDVAVARQASERLHHEGVVRVRRRAQHVHAPRVQLDDKRRVVRQQSAMGPHFSGEEVGRQERRPVRAHEGPPRRWALAAGRNDRRLQDARDRRAPDVMPDILQRGLNARVSPVGFSVAIRTTSTRMRACSDVPPVLSSVSV